jgi:hypothetical protein
MIPEPPDTYGLWGRVQAAAPPAWPDTDEDRMGTLATTWKQAAEPFAATAATDVSGLRPAWPDPAGEAYGVRLTEIRTAAGTSADAMNRVSGTTERFATIVTQVKSGIRELIEVNIPRYELTFQLVDGVREQVQGYFVTHIAEGVRELMNTDVGGLIAPDGNPDSFAGLGDFAAGAAGRTWDAIQGDVREKYPLLAVDGVFALAEANQVADARLLRLQASTLWNDGQAIDDFLRGPEAASLTEYERGVLRAQADDLSLRGVNVRGAAGRAAGAAEAISRAAPVVGFLGGVGWDLYESISNDWDEDSKDGWQILTGAGVSAAAGYVGGVVGAGATSWVAGAAFGAAAGSVVPVVGTIVGGIVGMGFGLVASGVVDGLWDGKSLAEAWNDGTQALADTGGAIVDGAEWAGGKVLDGAVAVGDWFDSLF